jgi:hypothetical protein
MSVSDLIKKMKVEKETRNGTEKVVSKAKKEAGKLTPIEVPKAKSITVTEIKKEMIPANTFDYNVIVEDVARESAREASKEIKALSDNIKVNFIKIGMRLITMKKVLVHGTFKTWMEQELSYSYNHACNFMRAARKFKDVEMITDLKLSPTALIALAKIEDERTIPQIAIEEAADKLKNHNDLSLSPYLSIFILSSEA